MAPARVMLGGLGPAGPGFATEAPDEPGETVAYYGRVGAPAPLLPQLAPAVGAAGANITVTYRDFPPEAKAAFEYAVTIWEGYLISKSEILIDAPVKGLPRRLSDCRSFM
jgi:hypothetical protein